MNRVVGSPGIQMDARIPAILQPRLREYADLAMQDLDGKIMAFYLEGSIALGEFNPRLSDIDFIAVLKSKASSADFQYILHIHRQIEQKYPWKMPGMYFQTRYLGCLDRKTEPFPNNYDGKIQWTDHFDLSSVTWWILKNHGVPVFGASPQSLNITVDMDQLVRMQHGNLNTYWASWTRPGRMLALTSDWEVQSTVPGIFRQFYTIHEHKITSKVKAGKYALTHLPECWHPLIREAIALREAPKATHYRSRIRRAFITLHFIRDVIQVCNDFLNVPKK